MFITNSLIWNKLIDGIAHLLAMHMHCLFIQKIRELESYMSWWKSSNSWICISYTSNFLNQKEQSKQYIYQEGEP